MAPSCRKRARSIRKSSSGRKTIVKKPLHSSKKDQSSVASSPAKTPVELNGNPSDVLEASADVKNVDNISACCTPKAERYRIPEIKTCPPAPKKRRVANMCSLRRTPIKFYAPSDVEMFFYFALRGIPV